MKTTIANAALLLFIGTIFQGTLANAQQNGFQQQTAPTPSQVNNQLQAQNSGVYNQLAMPTQKIGFRLANWQTIHSDGSPAQQQHIATLQQIGCEVKQDNHGGHVDIAFRCASWKTIPIQSVDQLQQWQQWLVNSEFETVVLNPPANSPMPAVKIRLADWKTIHAGSAEEATALKATFEMIGCEVAIDNHGDHIDMKMRCPNWNTIGLPNSEAAHVWQNWLTQSGFETQHDHSADGNDAHAGHDHATDGHEGHN